MDLKTRKYYSKILLFGEYTILNGSKAIAIPFERFFGQWKLSGDENASESLAHLKSYLECLEDRMVDHIDFDSWNLLNRDKLFFDSNIPMGYGAGSSGSVTAAVFDQFYTGKEQMSLEKLRANLALIESCFHGASSGTDPLVSFINQPILLHQDQTIELIDKDLSAINESLFLIDTKISRHTSPLVKWFKTQLETSKSFKNGVEDLSELNNAAIEAYVLQNVEALENTFLEISNLQARLFEYLIPKGFKSYFQDPNIRIKLCGAGGGGFLLAYGSKNHLLEVFQADQVISLV